MEPSAQGAAGAFPGRRLKGVPGPPPWAGGWGPRKGHVPKATRLSRVTKQKGPRSRGLASPTLIPSPYLTTSTPPFLQQLPYSHFLAYPSTTSSLSTTASLSSCPCPDVPACRSLRQVHRQAAGGPTPHLLSCKSLVSPTQVASINTMILDPRGHRLAWGRARFWAGPLRRRRSLLASFPHLSNKSGM